MAILFVAFQLQSRPPTEVINARIKAIHHRYVPVNAPNVKKTSIYDANTGTGLLVISQTFENESLVPLWRDTSRIVFFTDYPFGYTSIVDCEVADIARTLADALRRAPHLIARLHPPFSLVDVDLETMTLRYYGDAIGLSKCFETAGPEGWCLTNRCIAGCYALGKKPRPSETGWAMEQLSGWLHSSATPFADFRKTEPGALMTLTARGLERGRQELVGQLFHPDRAPAMFEGFDRLRREIQRFGTYGGVSLPLSGGRDSRATAAVAMSFFPDSFTLLTGTPPETEGIVARSLVEQLPEFHRFGDDGKLAYRRDGGALWKLRPRSAPAPGGDGLLDRARQWTRAMEGFAFANAMLRPCNASLFIREKVRGLGVPGLAGELARDYHYVPRPLPLDQFLRYLETVSADERFPTQRFTSRPKVDFARADAWPDVQSHIVGHWRKSSELGIAGYRRFDYIYLMMRVMKTAIGYAFFNQVALYLAPEFLSAAVCASNEDKHGRALTRAIVARYQTNWSSVPYADELPDVPAAAAESYYREELPWAGPFATEYLALLAGSPAFERPYDREKIEKHIAQIRDDPSKIPPAATFKAYGLLHRHAFCEMCEAVGADIDRLAALSS